MNVAPEFIKKIVVNALATKGANFGDFDNNKASQYFKDTYQDAFKKIIEDARQDAIKADLLGGLERKKPVVHDLVKRALEISLQHGAVMYANQIWEHSKIA